MSSSNALKYDINISASLYRGAFILFLYSFPLMLIVSVFHSFLAYALCFVFFIVALYISIKESKKTGGFRISEDALVEFEDCSSRLSIKKSSFYNGVFLYLSLQHKKGLIEKTSTAPNRLVIFRDSISEQDYRLIARLINQS